MTELAWACCVHGRRWARGRHASPPCHMFACPLQRCKLVLRSQVEVEQGEVQGEHAEYKLYLIQEWCNVSYTVAVLLCCAVPCCATCGATLLRMGKRPSSCKWRLVRCIDASVHSHTASCALPCVVQCTLASAIKGQLLKQADGQPLMVRHAPCAWLKPACLHLACMAICRGLPLAVEPCSMLLPHLLL